MHLRERCFPFVCNNYFISNGTNDKNFKFNICRTSGNEPSLD